MSLTERITADMKEALRAGEKERLSCLRMLLNDLKNAAEDAGAGLDAEAEQTVLRRAAKQRREAALAATEAGRAEAARAEETELAIVEAYLPKRMDEAETEAKVRALVAELGISERADTGRFMREWMSRYKAVSDGKLVQRVFGAVLSGTTVSDTNAPPDAPSPLPPPRAGGLD